MREDIPPEEITVKKLPYTWLPFHNEGDKPTNIFFIDKNNPNKPQDFSELTQINVPIDFILNKQLLVHPDYITNIQSYIQKNID